MHQGVMKSAGSFHGGNAPPNKEIDKRLAEQGDGRMFMMMARSRSGFINAPNKLTHQPKKP